MYILRINRYECILLYTKLKSFAVIQYGMLLYLDGHDPTSIDRSSLLYAYNTIIYIYICICICVCIEIGLFTIQWERFQIHFSH